MASATWTTPGVDDLLRMRGRCRGLWALRRRDSVTPTKMDTQAIIDAGAFAKLPLKIVVINDESGHLERIAATVQACYNDAELRLFQDGREAWQEMLRGDPVFLITSDQMPGMSGEEICQRLLARGAWFPVIVTSASPLTAKWLCECRAGA